MKFRHEFKHEIDYADVLALRSRLSAVAQHDENSINGRYVIRSLYFDNFDDKALLEKINGVNCREKFRLRLYNGDVSYILLEKKSKINGLCSKEQVQLTLNEAKSIIEGREYNAKSENPLLNELYIKMQTQLLKPKTIVEYTREAFVYPAGNVRVTLDYNIRTGISCVDFLNPDCVTVPAGDTPVVLEVKWDEYLPSVIRDIVQLPSKHTSAFSKYAVCRIYG